MRGDRPASAGAVICTSRYRKSEGVVDASGIEWYAGSVRWPSSLQVLE
jgi:hypothetical protein